MISQVENDAEMFWAMQWDGYEAAHKADPHHAFNIYSYDSDETLRLFEEAGNWTARHHNAVFRIIELKLMTRNYAYRSLHVSGEEYRDWLQRSKLPNSEKSRTLFLSYLVE
jgi:hypothetical protein